MSFQNDQQILARVSSDPAWRPFANSIQIVTIYVLGRGKSRLPTPAFFLQ
ncbi:MAG: hypothetical protein V2B20_17430 [Pseudomonadota bacterium]